MILLKVTPEKKEITDLRSHVSSFFSDEFRISFTLEFKPFKILGVSLGSYIGFVMNPRTTFHNSNLDLI